MDGAPLGEGGDDGLLIPAEEFRDLAVHALHGNVCDRFGTLVCGVFLSEHRRACKGGDGVLTGGLGIGVHRSTATVRISHDMGAGIGLEDDGIEITAVPIGGLFHAGDGVTMDGRSSVHRFHVGVIGKLEGVAPLAYRPDGRGEGVDEFLGIGIVSLDDFLLGIGKLHFPGFLLRLLLSGCGSVRVISCVLLLCGFRAVMRHVDGAHGRAAGEHQEQAQGDDGKLLVFRHPCFQFLHSRYPFWFPSASPMDSRRQPILFRFGKPNRTGRWCADRSKCYP
ncbi:hypothetical protein DW656_17490 [Coprococcus comes]|uniref:Uncharacterized protein n=1 Tax=Coprococcus comes TaxID=410072 RepID=A0A414QDL4_9FIRM|nr:hypothetical protein DW656_17490 [Coprococcus comes]